jgi:hypothetical protein
MATAKKTTNMSKMTPTQLKEKIESLEKENEKLKNSAYCFMCDSTKDKTSFYKSTDPRIKSGLSPICKKCAYDLAMRKDKNGEYHEPTKESIQLALRYLNKPFYTSLYDASIQEAESLTNGGTKKNPWTAYIKNVSMVNYVGETYEDSDMFKEQIIYEDEKTVDDVVKGREHQDTYSDYLKNKKDIIRLLGYDPFEKESISDQPFLYSQLLGLLDAGEESNEDMMRTASAISIVRGFLQQSKIDDAIAKLMSDITQLQNNSATIKSLQDSKGKLTGVIKDLAAESCISLKNSKNAKKGENTWTGKIKKIKDMNLREGEVNGFDLGTCRGMQQVMDMSNASIIKQLRLDESEYSDMLAEQREMIVKIRNDLDNYKEISRILLRENIDLKDYLTEHNMLPTDNLVDLNQLFSCFSDLEEDESENKVTEDEVNVDDQ